MVVVIGNWPARATRAAGEPSALHFLGGQVQRIFLGNAQGGVIARFDAEGVGTIQQDQDTAFAAQHLSFKIRRDDHPDFDRPGIDRLHHLLLILEHKRDIEVPRINQRLDEIPAARVQALVDHCGRQMRDGQGHRIGEQEQLDQRQGKEQDQRAAVPEDLHRFLVDEGTQALEGFCHVQSSLLRKVIAARNITTTM